MEIHANELRKGNIVYNGYEGGNEKLTAYQIAQIEVMNNGGNVAEYYRSLEYIPLTEEWLLKLGFWDTPMAFQLVVFGDEHKQLCLDMKCRQDGKNRLTSVMFEEKLGIGFEIDIKYVHRLQNLYFELKGEELTIKE